MLCRYILLFFRCAKRANANTSFLYKKGEGIVVVDAGGGTIDMSAYKQNTTETKHKKLEEIATPQCL